MFDRSSRRCERHVDRHLLDLPDPALVHQPLGPAHDRQVVPAVARRVGAAPSARPSSTRSQASAGSIVKGFSTSTCAPASSAAFACSWWRPGGLATRQMSMPAVEHVAVVLARDREAPVVADPLEQLRALSGIRRRTRPRRRVAPKFGRWEATAQEPAPMTPSRSLLTPPSHSLGGILSGFDSCSIPEAVGDFPGSRCLRGSRCVVFLRLMAA